MAQPRSNKRLNLSEFLTAALRRRLRRRDSRGRAELDHQLASRNASRRSWRRANATMQPTVDYNHVDRKATATRELNRFKSRIYVADYERDPRIYLHMPLGLQYSSESADYTCSATLLVHTIADRGLDFCCFRKDLDLSLVAMAPLRRAERPRRLSLRSLNCRALHGMDRQLGNDMRTRGIGQDLQRSAESMHAFPHAQDADPGREVRPSTSESKENPFPSSLTSTRTSLSLLTMRMEPVLLSE